MMLVFIIDFSLSWGQHGLNSSLVFVLFFGGNILLIDTYCGENGNAVRAGNSIDPTVFTLA